MNNNKLDNTSRDPMPLALFPVSRDFVRFQFDRRPFLLSCRPGSIVTAFSSAPVFAPVLFPSSLLSCSPFLPPHLPSTQSPFFTVFTRLLVARTPGREEG